MILSEPDSNIQIVDARNLVSTKKITSDTNLEKRMFPLWPPSRFEVFVHERQESSWHDRPWTSSSLQSNGTASAHSGLEIADMMPKKHWRTNMPGRRNLPP